MRLSFHDCNLTISFIQFLAAQRSWNLISHGQNAPNEDTHKLHPDTWCQVFNPKHVPILPPFIAMCGNLPSEDYRHGVPSAKQLSNAVGQNRWLELLLWPPSRATMTLMTIGPNLYNSLSFQWIDEKRYSYSKSNLLGCNPVEQSWVLPLTCYVVPFVHLDILQETTSGSCTLISVEHLSRAKRALGTRREVAGLAATSTHWSTQGGNVQ